MNRAAVRRRRKIIRNRKVGEEVIKRTSRFFKLVKTKLWFVVAMKLLAYQITHSLLKHR